MLAGLVYTLPLCQQDAEPKSVAGYPDVPKISRSQEWDGYRLRGGIKNVKLSVIPSVLARKTVNFLVLKLKFMLYLLSVVHKTNPLN